MAASKSYKAELVGVLGHPVAENPTIVMQEAAFHALHLNFRYLTIEVLPEDLEAAIRGLRAFNMKGINLTIPHKVAVLKYLDRLSDSAKTMGAVNTVYRQGDLLIGENTDGKGFLTALTRDGKIDPAGKSFVIMGAGGAARAITVELAMAGAGHLTVVNKDPNRGKTLTDLLNKHTRTKAVYVPWDSTYTLPENTDVLVNATSIGLFPDVEARPNILYDSIRPGMLVCDVIPNPPHSAFLHEAERRGALTLDGLSMLVYQGAIAFKLWTGQEAPVEVMKDALIKEFNT